MFIRNFLVIFLIFVGSCAFVRSDEEIIEDSAAVPSIDDLDGMVEYILYNDTRLVRYNVPSDAAWLRQEKLCNKHLDYLLKQLVNSFSITPKDLTTIVKLVALCSSEHPEFRSSIGLFGDGAALKSIVTLLDEDNDALTAAVGNAIWILSFNNQYNHNYFVQNAGEKMASVLVRRAKALKSNVAPDKSNAALAVMWMAAALQNLAASYCGTESGHCWWENEDYGMEEHDDVEDESHGLYLDEDSPMEIDGSTAAEKIAKAADGELAAVLQKLVCAQPMGQEEETIWASKATIDGTHSADPRIITWAVAGSLKNLSLYDKSREVTLKAKDCLCALTESHDWLESSKADDALHRLGITDEDCWGEYEEEEEDERGEL